MNDNFRQINICLYGDWKYVSFCIIVPKSNTEIMRPFPQGMIHELPDLFFLISLDPDAGFVSIIVSMTLDLAFPLPYPSILSFILFAKYVF